MMDKDTLGNIIFWNIILIGLFVVITRNNVKGIRGRSIFKIYNLVIAIIFWIFWIVSTIALIEMLLSPRVDPGVAIPYLFLLVIVPLILLALVGTAYGIKYFKNKTR